MTLTLHMHHDEILNFFFYDSFLKKHNAKTILIMMILGNTFFNFLWVHLSNEMNYYKKTRNYFYTTLSSFFVTILISSFLIENYSFFGAGIMSLISNFTISFVAFFTINFMIKRKLNYTNGILFYFSWSLIFIPILLLLNGDNFSAILLKVFILFSFIIYIIRDTINYFKKNNLKFL